MAIYKDLSEVERAFSGLKKCDRNASPLSVRRHGEKGAFIVSLAFLLNRALEKNSSPQAGTSPPRKLGDLKTVRVVDLDLGNREHKQSVTQGSRRAASILRTLGIRDPNRTRCTT